MMTFGRNIQKTPE